MRYLGLDLGTRTLGIAISDSTHTIATTYQTLHFNENQEEEILPILKEIVRKEQIEKIILGFPKNMNNTIGPRAETTIDFQHKIKQYLNIEVILQDERLTTKQATEYMLEANISRKKRKKKIDSLAANIILQTYLDTRRNNND